MNSERSVICSNEYILFSVRKKISELKSNKLQKFYQTQMVQTRSLSADYAAIKIGANFGLSVL